MSGFVPRHRQRWRTLALRLALVAACGALTATLAAGLQVRAVRVAGASRFPAAEVESALRFAVGTPTMAMRADRLRDAARAVPWVADAQVQVSIDGVVSCEVVERRPVAVAVDGGTRSFVDGEGHLLGPAAGTVAGPELHGFAADPESRAAVLAAVAALESRWGARLLRAERRGPHDVLLAFADSPCTALVDPAEPDGLLVARRVLAAWTEATAATPLCVDVRVPGRVAVQPEPPAVPVPAAAAQGAA